MKSKQAPAPLPSVGNRVEPNTAARRQIHYRDVDHFGALTEMCRMRRFSVPAREVRMKRLVAIGAFLLVAGLVALNRYRETLD